MSLAVESALPYLRIKFMRGVGLGFGPGVQEVFDDWQIYRRAPSMMQANTECDQSIVGWRKPWRAKSSPHADFPRRRHMSRLRVTKGKKYLNKVPNNQTNRTDSLCLEVRRMNGRATRAVDVFSPKWFRDVGLFHIWEE